jgi:hypothetical protein
VTRYEDGWIQDRRYDDGWVPAGAMDEDVGEEDEGRPGRPKAGEAGSFLP